MKGSKMDVEAIRRSVAAIGVVGKIDGYDVIRRDSALEMIMRHEAELEAWKNALWKACGDNHRVVKATLDSQRGGA